MNVAVIGLGKLGLPLAALIASSGHDVIGCDASDHTIEQLNMGEFPSNEPGLSELISRSLGNLKFTNSVKHAVQNSDVAFVIVPTPSLPTGHFSNEILLAVLKEIGTELKNMNRAYVVDVVSTVMPGSMNGEIKETLQASSGKKIGLELGICYNPEFIALGSVIHDMQYPDMQLLGASQEWAAELVEDVLTSITAQEVPIRRMSLEEAEIVKISINNFVTSKIAFANMLYELSFNFANVNIDVVTESIGLDSRIGGKYLRGGAPFGGPCFPRDTRALAALLNDFSIEESIPRVIERFNNSHSNFLVEKIISETNKSDIVGFIGVSYKQFTKVTEESPSLLMAKALIASGRKVICWDPNIDNSDDVPTWIELVDSLEAICSTSNYLVLARPLLEINRDILMGQLRGKRLFDIWRQLDGGPLNRQLV